MDHECSRHSVGQSGMSPTFGWYTHNRKCCALILIKTNTSQRPHNGCSLNCWLNSQNCCSLSSCFFCCNWANNYPSWEILDHDQPNADTYGISADRLLTSDARKRSVCVVQWDEDPPEKKILGRSLSPYKKMKFNTILLHTVYTYYYIFNTIIHHNTIHTNVTVCWNHIWKRCA